MSNFAYDLKMTWTMKHSEDWLGDNSPFTGDWHHYRKYSYQTDSTYKSNPSRIEIVVEIHG